jgi:hypothetical protein
MKIVIHYLEQIEGVHIFGIIALVIFLTFFTMMVIHALSLKKKDVEKWARIPIDEIEPESEKQ